MINTDEANTDSSFNFAKIRARYEKLNRGDQAQLGKRIGSPDELAMIPVFYKLFSDIKPSDWHLRAAFILPFVRYSNEAPSFGEYLGTMEKTGKIGNIEKRVLQIARSSPQQDMDMIYLRRLLMRFDIPAVNWDKSGFAKLFSTEDLKNKEGKKRLLEQYFIARFSGGKGEK